MEHWSFLWLPYSENLGSQLPIDETSLSRGELYTILTNKAAKGGNGSIVAIVAGTKAETAIEIIRKIPESQRKIPRAIRVTDRFHVQRLVIEVLQEMRIKLRWEALDQENDAIEHAKATQKEYVAEVLPNADTLKPLLARSRYALYKKASTWTENQQERAQLVFERFPDLKKAYDLAQELSSIFTNTKEKIYGLTRLAKWHERVRQSGFKSFNTVARFIENHYKTIVNYFDNRSTNASAESFNATI